MVEKTAIVKNANGLHARPCTEIYKKAKEYEDTEILLVDVSSGETYNTNSIMSLLTSFKIHGEPVIVRATGKYEKEAVEEIATIIETFEI